LNNFPPEKYFEACITYHLVNDFKERFDKRVFPFSISQIEEKSKGYDFGYTFSNESFFIQYKRPLAYDTDTSIYSWQISREQLSIINHQNYALKTYYALPAFVNTKQWYEALEHTYFVIAPKLEDYLNKKKRTKTNNIYSNIDILKSWSHYSSIYASKQRNTVLKLKQNTVTFEDVISYAKSIDHQTKECTWIYLIEEENYEF
jgi:hypothetical protein